MTTIAKQCEFIGGPFDGHVCPIAQLSSGRQAIIGIPVNRRTMQRPTRIDTAATDTTPIAYYELHETRHGLQYRFLGYRRVESQRLHGWHGLFRRAVGRLQFWKWK